MYLKPSAKLMVPSYAMQGR